MRLQNRFGRCAVAAASALLLLAALVAALSIPARSVTAAGRAPYSAATTALSDNLPAASQASRAAPAPHEPPERAVRRAWQQAVEAGRYAFVSDMTQSLYAAPGLAAAGSGPQTEQAHLEGSADLRGRTLELRLWQDGSSGLAEGVELRVDDGVAYTRRLAATAVDGQGAQPAATGAWQESPDISQSFAPDGDALAFLAGIKNVAEIPAGTGKDGSPLDFRRFSFDIDGPALASYMRDRLQEQLIANRQAAGGGYPGHLTGVPASGG